MGNRDKIKTIEVTLEVVRSETNSFETMVM
jgi:hypothetical protein